MVLNNNCDSEKIKKEFFRLLELSKNEDITYKILWDKMKVVLKYSIM